jgi:Glutaminase A six helical-hairpin domain/Domain of unknown function (DUF5127)/Domain of unknown function (DUF4964)
MKTFCSFLLASCLLLSAAETTLPPFRPPAVPLVTHDPYFSIWSPADKLTGADTVHWTGKPHRLTSLVRIDGKAFRVMGKEPADVPALPQKSVEVLPTRTIYTFEGEGVRLTLTFMTPALPDDLEVLARPVTYVTWEISSTGRRRHQVELYFDASAEISVNVPSQKVRQLREKVSNLYVEKVGSTEQETLGKRGDDLRIDWGYLFVASPKSENASPMTVDAKSFLRDKFIKEGSNLSLELLSPFTAPAEDFITCVILDAGKISSKSVSRWLMLAYDEEFSIQYMKKNLRPYWRRNGDDAAALLKKAAADYESLKKRCEEFDAELMADLRRAGGEEYARLAALAYRQCFAAGKFVADANGQPLQFCKENSSNGCIGTADVFYPMSPQFLLFGPTLAKSFLVPFMNYAASARWKFPFAPHDLGTYPQANGQVYGGGERSEQNQMPVEESGNLLILFGAIAQMEGNAEFAGLWWPTLERWAEYLKAKGFDPENQLCTDDFAGHLAHNVNLSAKAIIGLGAFGKLCELRGDHAKAEEYSKLAHSFAQRWVKEADDEVGQASSLPPRTENISTSENASAGKETGKMPVPLRDHFRLAFDRPGTWSQKYNLVWDRILGLDLFPAEVARKEMDFYKKVQNQYGLPLDNRKDYTKLDWTVWTATLTQNRADFEALVDPVYRFLNETPDRLPMTDWYDTKTARRVGFTARPVVGAVFLPLLYDKAVWHKWASRDKTKASGWAPIPQPPKIKVVVPAADTLPAMWHYTTTKPAKDWSKPGYDDSGWKPGKSGFGTEGTPGAVVVTVWNTPDIWLRREVDIPADKLKNLELWIHHDEDAEIYINGLAAASLTGYATAYDAQPMNAACRAALKPGKNLVAVHCHQTGGGQYIDVGLVEVEAAQ